MTNEQFEDLINQAIQALPVSIREKLNNVEIVLEEGSSPNNSLFGLYHGQPQTQRGSTYGYAPTLPDKITIWKGTVETYAGGEDKIPALVRRVVWHEIGHHFGFDEAAIRKLEEKWAKEGKV
ncbi:MAG: metallopeptidase family protein [Patescibacteria group bacterium]|nr:metallopeptidase family protein [Patescibacteria group bacterium]